jgi:hypothetical protein
MVVEDELPDWLREEQFAEAEAPPLDWLADESVMEEEEAEAPEPVAAEVEPAEDDGMVVEDELPDWLREEQPAEAEAPPLDWLADESVMEEEEAEAPEPVAEEVVAEVEDEFDEEALIDSEGLPDWLREEEPTMEEAQPVQPAAEVESVQAPEVEAVEEDGVVDLEGLPDWLRDTQAVSEPALVDGEVPAWLSDDAAEEIAPAEEEAFTEEAAKIPDWLQAATRDEEGLVDEAAADVIDVGEAPPISWLERLRQNEVAEVEAPTEEVAVPEAPPPAEEKPQPVAEVAIPPEVVKEEPEQVEAVENRLSMGKAALDAGDLDDALEVFQELVESSETLDQIIESLTQNLDKYAESPAIYEVLGDAQMRNGQLNQALQSYRAAISKL